MNRSPFLTKQVLDDVARFAPYMLSLTFEQSLCRVVLRSTIQAPLCDFLSHLPEPAKQKCLTFASEASAGLGGSKSVRSRAPSEIPAFTTLNAGIKVPHYA
jgi:hypothetical protein